MDTFTDQPLSDEWGERISAYFDGELPEAERREVEQKLETDPAAAAMARDFSRLREACASAPAGVFSDLRETVIAEVARREDAADEDRVAVASRLEPEGEFGLPFGKSTRSWAWAVVAVAAALMIGFFGRPAPPAAGPAVASKAFTPQINEVVHRVRQALPQTRTVQITTTPEGKRRLERLLASRGLRVGQPTPSAPPEQLALQRFGVPVETAAADEDDQLLLVSAEQPTVNRLIDDLEKEEGVFRVEADRPSEVEGTPTERMAPAVSRMAAPVGAAPGVALRISISKRSSPVVSGPGATTPSVVVPAGRTPVLFIIHAKPRS